MPAAVAAGHWEQLRLWVESETGMDFAGTRFGRLRDAVTKVLGRPTSDADLDRIMSHDEGRGRFLDNLTGQLTVGESFFLRNEHHFRALRENVLPQILQENAERREIRVWSAGCATGEEPYSMAIVLDQVLAGRTGWQISVLGTDLNPGFLERARQASYRPWSFRQTDIHQNRSYFTPDGEAYRLADRVRGCVRFAYLNLVKDVYPSPLSGTVGLDLILFRNVAIYLQPAVTSAILERFREALRPGGWLLLGETEVNLAPTKGFEVRRFEQATFYQRRAVPGSSVSQPPPLPVPVLATVLPLTGPAMLTVPELPAWVPLPAIRRRGKKDRSAASFPQPAAGLGSAREQSAWERVEHCLRSHDLAQAERILAGILDQKQRVATRLRYARELLALAEGAKARHAIDACLKDDPLQVEAQLLKASLAEEAGDLDQAEQSYRKALYIDRNCPIAHFHLALVQQQRGNAAGARRSLQTTLKLAETKDPHEVVEYGDGVCYGRLKEMALTILDA